MTRENYQSPACLLLFAAFVIGALFIWQGNSGINLGDEGYLWYGVQRVVLGEVPIRDFMAYDPGRYYWSAMLIKVVGINSLMSLRATVAVFQILGLFAALLLIAQSTKGQWKVSKFFLLLSAATLVVWMFPRHKLFDISLSIFLIGALTFLIAKPLPRRFFLAGTCIGLVATFGRNHGVYGLIGSFGVLVWLHINHNSRPNPVKNIALWGVGVAVGFLPVILMAMLVPGFAVAFWDSVRFLFEQKATNLPLPVPWPWTVNFTALPIVDKIRALLVGLFFIGTLAFAALSISWVVLQKLKKQAMPPAFVACAFLAFPYAHYAFSRADLGHLAQGIFPALVGCLVLLSAAQRRIQWPLTIILCTASVWATHASHPGWQCLASRQCVNVDISGNTFKIQTGIANDIVLLRNLNQQFTANGESFIVTPFWPGAYALLERRSPTWEIYALWPRTESFEDKEIERIKSADPQFAFVINHPLDGREELRFRNTHPKTHQYILDNFEPVALSDHPAYQIYQAKSGVQ